MYANDCNVFVHLRLMERKTNEIDIVVLLSIAHFINKSNLFPFIFFASLCLIYNHCTMRRAKWIACRFDVDVHGEYFNFLLFPANFFWSVATLWYLDNFSQRMWLNGLNGTINILNVIKFWFCIWDYEMENGLRNDSICDLDLLNRFPPFRSLTPWKLFQLNAASGSNVTNIVYSHFKTPSHDIDSNKMLESIHFFNLFPFH